MTGTNGIACREFCLSTIIFSRFPLRKTLPFPGNDGERIRDAARFSECDRFIEALPEQYETVCGKSFRETGVDFSGGESQRICLARAFYKNSDIWILDEPSAAIDPIAEDSIFEYRYPRKAKRRFLWYLTDCPSRKTAT